MIKIKLTKSQVNFTLRLLEAIHTESEDRLSLNRHQQDMLVDIQETLENSIDVAELDFNIEE